MPRLGGALRDCGTYDRARSADGGDARRRRRRRLVVTDWFAHARERGTRESRVGGRVAARLKLVRVFRLFLFSLFPSTRPGDRCRVTVESGDR